MKFFWIFVAINEPEIENNFVNVVYSFQKRGFNCFNLPVVVVDMGVVVGGGVVTGGLVVLGFLVGFPE